MHARPQIFALSLCLACLFLLAACRGEGNGSFQGYVEGDYVYLASARAGRLDRLAAGKGETCARGELLAELESERERQALAAAEENLAQAEAILADMQTGRRPEEMAMAEAQLKRARAEAENFQRQLARNEGLYASSALSRKALDQSRSDAKASQARVAELERQVDVWNLPERTKRIEAQEAAVRTARAMVSQARWDLAQKRIEAPAAGLVCDTLFREGEWVPQGSPVVQLLPPGNVKLRFFVPEEQLAALAIGAEVEALADGMTTPVRARVVYLAQDAEYTPPVIYSNETRAKLCFMAEAKPSAEDAARLHPGQPLAVRRVR
ncbi:MAG: HlyD family efflux transporter periplasmic adaptor subunit [Desulfovibrio sp.]|nr:HlyD family efflux transporter periplasmic adaptor subunit [Desulfovibrio sp.]